MPSKSFPMQGACALDDKIHIRMARWRLRPSLMLATDAIGAENDMIGATCELAKKGGRGGSAVRIRIAESRGLPPPRSFHMLKAEQMEGEFVAGEGLTLTRWKLMVDDAAVVVTSLRTEYEENTNDGQVVVKLGGCGRRCQVTSSNISRSM